MSLLSDYLQDESGATAMEYALILTLISVALIGGANTLGQNINTRFSTIASSASTAG